VVDRDVAGGTITYVEEDGSLQTVPVTGGHCKLQWKPDMGMRWAALGVDYEMYGKDHLTSAKLYDAICRIAGGTPPEQYMFELFLDDQGQKISKSKGNGITLEQWLTYGTAESLALFMFQKPRAAKRLYFDVIPKAIDDYTKAIQLRQDSASFYSNLGAAYYMKKDWDPAAQAYEHALLLDPDIFGRISHSGVTAQLPSPQDRARFDYLIAKLYAKQGDPDRSLEYLRRCLEEGYKAIGDVYKDPAFSSLRKDARFDQLMANKPPAIPE